MCQSKLDSNRYIIIEFWSIMHNYIQSLNISGIPKLAFPLAYLLKGVIAFPTLVQ